MTVVNLYFILLTSFLVLWASLYFTVGVRINVPIGVALYGIFRIVFYQSGKVIKRVASWGRRTEPRLPERPRQAKSVSQFNSVHNLHDPFDVVLGYDGMRAVKINLRRHHTIIGSSTGGGKTNLLNSILIQLFGRGPLFTSVCDVYLIDLKGDEFDYLNMWIPMLAGYATIDETSIGSAINLLAGLIRQMETGQHDKHALLIIDEMAFLTAMASDKNQEREARILLTRIMAQYRTWGTVIGAVQHAKYDIVPTQIRVNMDRKIALTVESKDHAKTILGFRPEKHELPRAAGAFLLNEPGKRDLISGQALLVQVPQEIEAVLGKNIRSSLRTWQEKLFYDMCQGLVPGGPTPGIRAIKDATEYTQYQVQAAKRHYALSGALVPPNETGGQSYLLAHDLPVALGLVRNYVRAGKWEQDPPAFVVKQTNGKEGDAEES